MWRWITKGIEWAGGNVQVVLVGVLVPVAGPWSSSSWPTR